MQLHAIVLAGGGGNRFGGETPKQFVRLAGEPILLRTIRSLGQAPLASVVVVAHPTWLDETARLVSEASLAVPIRIVPGGATRNESTRQGLAALGAAADDIVIVHDAVRPLLPADVIRRCVEPIASGRADATDTVIPSADTLVIVDDEAVVEIPDRSRYRRGQTPQAFRVGILNRAYAAAAAMGDLGATDDCSLALRYVPGLRLIAVDGDDINMKITTRLDLVLADRMLQLAVLIPEPSDEGRQVALEDARVLVVGGTNGIGQAIAQLATDHGAHVRVGGTSTGLDIRDPSTVADVVETAAEELGGLDHVVCTAGILRVGALASTEPADLAEIIDVNLTGSLYVARAAYRHLRASRGSLTLFASSSFTRGRPDFVAYSASKAALVNATQGLAEEWAADRIRVNAVSPERTDTPMRRLAFPEEDRSGMLTASEVAAATLRLLCSDLTGQVVDLKRDDVGPSS